MATAKNTRKGDRLADAQPCFNDLSKAVRACAQDVGHAARATAFAMLRRRFGCRSMDLRREDLPEAIRMIEARRPYFDALQAARAHLEPSYEVRAYVISRGVDRAFEEDPGTLEEFEQHLLGLAEQGEAFVGAKEARRLKTRARQTSTQNSTANARAASIAGKCLRLTQKEIEALARILDERIAIRRIPVKLILVSSTANPMPRPRRCLCKRRHQPRRRIDRPQQLHSFA